MRETKKSITVKDYRTNGMVKHPDQDFRIDSMVNTTRYQIGEFISSEEVNHLVEDEYIIKIIKR